MKIKTADLIGPALDWAACYALGNPNGFCGQMFQRPLSYVFRPSTSGSEVIDLMEREKIGVLPPHGHRGGAYRAFVYEPSQHDLTFDDATTHTMFGPTLRIAVCRCLVAAKLGDEVDVPDELLP